MDTDPNSNTNDLSDEVTEDGTPALQTRQTIHDADTRPAIRRLEAVLFLAREPLNSRKISQLAGLSDGTQARTLIRQLNQHYDHSGRSFHIEQIADGYQLRTRPHFSMWLKQLQHTPPAIRLTGPSMETLAVVAYRQPVLKSEVEAIRGVSCGELLRQLMDRGLVRYAGRSTELGQPFLYGTTKRFLEVFGLANLDALPRHDKLRSKGLPELYQSPNLTAEKQSNSPEHPLDESESNSENQSPEQNSNARVSQRNEEDSQEESIQ